MNYQEAVKWIDRLWPDETELPEEGIEALAVLRRAEPVMGAVEKSRVSSNGPEYSWIMKSDQPTILRECLTYKKGE